MKFSSSPRARVLAFILGFAAILFSGALCQAQPSWVGSYPDGTVLFQETNSLSVTILPSSGSITSLSISMLETNLDGVGSSNYLTSGNGVTLTTVDGNVVASTPLTSNTFYKAFFTIVDSSGTLTNSLKFDTIVPSYTWEAEDYDYGGGKYFDNTTNAYVGLYATKNVDAFNASGGNAAYRPINDGTDNGGDLGNENTSDTPRAGWSALGYADYDVGWNNNGNWGNYTRHYPAGKWNIFMRGAGWAANSKSAILMQGGPNGTLLGTFTVPNSQVPGNEYQSYTWVPVANVAGDPIEWDTDGSAQTLTVMTGSGGSYNANFYMLVPVNPNIKPKPFVSNVTPNSSTNVFTPTNLFSFVANSVPGMQQSNIVVTANGVPPAGLVLSGSSHSWAGSFPLQSNIEYNVSITVSDANGSSTYTETVGTFAANSYTWEAEDWDHDSGQYIDNPQLDAYRGLEATPGIDANNNQSGNSDYRQNDTGNLGNETTGDAKRSQYVKGGTNDYDIGWTSGGVWANYTRHFPAGTYNVYLRGASPNGQNDAIKLYWVTNGVGTQAQGLSEIGQFNVPKTGGWQNWSWVPLTDASGNPVVITNTGAAATIRMNEDNGGWNGNFFMLVPPDTGRPVISGLYPNGLAQFQRTNSFGFTVTSPVALTPSDVTVTVNGVVQNNLVIGGSSTVMTVSWPHLQPDTAYNVGIVVNTPYNDAATTSVTFDTFSSAYYTWEAEDWDYNGGSFFDNPQVDFYAGLAGSSGIDCYNNQNGSSAYRLNDPGDLGNEKTGDALRDQYVNAGTNDYDVGWTAKGQWANYTRHYPKGAYNVYLRCASPNGQADACELWQVTAGLGTTTQTTNELGQFNIPLTGGYQAWTFTPLTDKQGNLVTLNTTGNEMTFQLVEVAGGWNMNYFMLVPVGSSPTGPVMTANLSRDGKSLIVSWSPAGNSLYASPKMGAGATWSLVGTNNPATIPITGSAQFFYVGK